MIQSLSNSVSKWYSKKFFSCFIISIHHYYLDLNKKSFANSSEKQIVIDSFQT